MLKKISEESGGATVQPASADSERPDEAGKRPLPHWDYAYTQGGCYYIAHAYQHSIIGIGYGAVYYEDELVGCPPHVHTPPYP